MENSIDKTIQEKIEQIKSGSNMYTTGQVRLVREYIIEATGLDGIKYFESVIIGEGSEGYVDAINQDCVIIVLTDIEGKIYPGDKVQSTGKEFTARYTPDAIGHVVDMFGEEQLTGKQFETLSDLPIESEPISIMDRSTVNRPLLTGITGVDLLYPIGKGQRQLIIGDKKTGKTQIVLDTIINQKDKQMICIYVAIGKTKKDVKDIYGQLLRHGAMAYTVILAAFNDTPAPVLRNTPYVAMSIARTYMEQGQDVLVCIDDLKRHADVCREIALLMGKVPGRDAYPPNIFYSHSRMLEMGCQHKDGGSITAMPICETKGGDITDYISTNIISITDGQIVLSAKNFERGQKPAIHYGLSVSRLGGAVQNDKMKKEGAPIRRELLSYLEQRDIFELANMDEMSAVMRRNMARGSKIIELLCQRKYDVKTSEEMLEMFRKMEGEFE